MNVQRRPLTARSIIASTLLGTTPPRLSTRRLVRVGQLFGIAPGTIRVALSRMVAAGELTPTTVGYELAGHLSERQDEQKLVDDIEQRRWLGTWETVIIDVGARSSSERNDHRRTLTRRRLAEVREGVWMRPANLDPERRPQPNLRHHTVIGTLSGTDDASLCEQLFDLGRWAGIAAALNNNLSSLRSRLDDGDASSLAPAFVESAAAIRHLLTDPMMPPELMPPEWPATALRSGFARFDKSFRFSFAEFVGEIGTVSERARAS